MNQTESSSQLSHQHIQSAEVVLPCSELNETLAFYTETLGLVVEFIFPADNPKVAVLCGHGIRVRLEISAEASNSVIRLLIEDATVTETDLIAPNGTRFILTAALPPVALPAEQQSLVISQLNEKSKWVIGRAGMEYRDLIPNRQGGRFIASHIRINEGGPVPDYVHFHRVRFQLIFCIKGWVKLLYEDQGEAFVLKAGDCVLQPPEIRHRVLESSVGLEVVEIGCPAIHETYADRNMLLPTETINPDHDFSGQRFVRHIADNAQWQPWRLSGFECRDSGIGTATKGLAGVNVVRPQSTIASQTIIHQEEFLFFFIMNGHLILMIDGKECRLQVSDSIVIPHKMPHSIMETSEDLEFLEVRLSDQFKQTEH